MKIDFRTKERHQTGSALLLTLIMTGIALATLAGALAWSASTARLTYRSNQYTCSVAAAEAATEKVLSQISQDFLKGGEKLINDNLANYQRMTLTASDSSYWADWEFNDAGGHVGQTFVQCVASSDYVVLNSTYAGLRGFISTCTLVANARQPNALQNVVGAVRQDLQLARIPIFQFAMYTSSDMEISCGQPFAVTGRVHSNGQIYVEPDSTLTFQSDVTAVGDILFQRSPLDSRTPPSGGVVYEGRKLPHDAALYLPIGTNNTPAAVREIIQPPPSGEDPNSPIGRERYYNLADLIVQVSNTNIVASSGLFNSFATIIPTNQVALFVSTNKSFSDAREGKTVLPIDLNIGALASWSATNSNLRVALGSRDVSSVYVVDRRKTAAANLLALRVTNGKKLPGAGLTVATADPLYVLGHYNQTNDANLGTANTSTTVPASLVGDAITILSQLWSDPSSRGALPSRKAGPTTVNAAILAGAVETARGNYGGGMENFPRFLESWGSAAVFTYNGSMVKMFPSLYATNIWGTANIYDPPKRNWAFDLNFNQSTKLPPRTPSLQKLIRSQWAVIAPNQIAAPASP